MKSRRHLLVVLLPFLGVLLVFFFLSSLDRAHIRKKTEALIQEQLQATAEILKVDLAHFLKKNFRVDEIFDSYAREETIYYMALLDENKRILSWSSRFEGYLPLSLQRLREDESWVIDSPAGKIYNLFSSFSPEEGLTYFLYLGYSLKNLDEMILYSRRNFLFIFGIIFVIGVISLLGFSRLQSYYLEKEAEAEEQKREKERYREISAFTSAVAHEIKNPLNSLSLLFEWLQKKAPEKIKEELLPGKEEVRKISRIIDQFSSALKPFRLHKEVFLVRELVMAVQESLKKELEERGVRVRYEESLSLRLEADKGLMGQVLTNVLRNAAEASQGGEVSVRARQEKKKIVIAVQDAGSGIAEEDKQRLFEPFFSRKKEGMGIGLYISKKIIEAHEGKIEVKSESGKGTTVLIQIGGG